LHNCLRIKDKVEGLSHRIGAHPCEERTVENEKDKESGRSLLDPAREPKELRRKSAFAHLSAMLSKEDLELIDQSGREFRMGFALR